MAIARSFTSRSKRSTTSIDESNNMPNVLTKASLRTFDRSKISAPVLLSATNVEALNAPDIEVARKLRKVSSVSSHSSRNSDRESDTSSTSPRSRGTSVTDSSSIGSSPSSPKPGELNSGYFTSPKHATSPPVAQIPRRAASSADIKRRALSFEPTPALPQRAPSHSKIAHEALARKRSLQSLAPHHQQAPTSHPAPSPRVTPAVQRELRSSRDIFNHRQHDAQHPFGRELEQLDEIAEEFNGAVRDAEREEDAAVMRSKNLARFEAADYIKDLESIWDQFWPPSKPVLVHRAGWI